MAASTDGRDAWSRRRFLAALGTGAVLSLSARGGGTRAASTGPEYPFALGVASGEPAADGFVIWTRIVAAGTRATERPLHGFVVDWEVAEDERFARVVRRGSAFADPAWAHAVHVDVDGLRADRIHWYRFRCSGATSPVGRSRTLPRAGARVARLRLAVASCQHYEHGWFSAYRHMLADDLDLVLHVGDYLYEGSWGMRLRAHESPRGAVTLDDYRDRHACYKQDADLQGAHAAYPWLFTWDDHEVANDYTGEALRDSDPQAFAARRTAAYRAWFEHMPVRRWRRPRGNALPLAGHIAVGDLVSLHTLDARQHRALPACAHQGEMIEARCAERRAPTQSMLGAAQQRWLFDGLAASKARWNVIAQPTLLAPLDRVDDDGVRRVWADGWDGYAGARDALLGFVDEAAIGNVVVLGGDMHAHYVADLHRDADDVRSPIVATEFVGTSITSQGADQASLERDLPHNPHIRYVDGRRRGYLRCEIAPARWTTDLRAVDDATDPRSGASTLATYHVEDGRAGAVR